MPNQQPATIVRLKLVTRANRGHRSFIAISTLGKKKAAGPFGSAAHILGIRIGSAACSPVRANPSGQTNLFGPQGYKSTLHLDGSSLTIRKVWLDPSKPSQVKQIFSALCFPKQSFTHTGRKVQPEKFGLTPANPA